ncbi:MAG: M48 family metallopeptidase [Candidatus Acidiferrales bacterium]
MRKSFVAQWVAIYLAALLVALPCAAAPQGQPQDMPQTSQDQSQTSGQPTTSDQPLPQQTNPNVKTGSEADVNAIGNRKVGHGPDFYSLQSDIAIGKQYAQMVDRQAKFITDPVVNEYVNRVGQNLVRNSDAKVPFTIKVIDSGVVNAFALPGGFLYINSGLILQADSEAELAGVMSHEIGHVCARHGTRDMTKQDIVQIASIPAMIFIPYSWAGYAMYQGLNFGIPMTFLKFSRDHEREADYLGTQYMYKAGYDPNAFVSFFEKLEAQEKKQPGTIPKVFETHPPTPDRIEAIQKEIETILPSKDEYIVNTSEFDAVKTRLQAIENNQRVKDSGPNKPTLRKRTDQNKGGSETPSDMPSDIPTTTTSTTTTSDDNSGPPTLKRRPDDDNQQQQQQQQPQQP